jgi:hypothetical protein
MDPVHLNSTLRYPNCEVKPICQSKNIVCILTTQFGFLNALFGVHEKNSLVTYKSMLVLADWLTFLFSVFVLESRIYR